MSEETAKTTERTMPVGTVLALMTGVLSLGGVGGAVANGSTVASELREFRAEMRGDIQALRATLVDRDKAADRIEGRVGGLEERVRALELGTARPPR